MKTSNILFLCAAVILLTSQLWYDFALSAEYENIRRIGLKQYQKSKRFEGFMQVPMESFDSINIKTATLFDIEVEYGKKQAVWIRAINEPQYKISRAGKTLVLDLSEEAKEDDYRRNFKVIIISPTLKSLTADTIENKHVKRKRSRTGDISVSNFSQDSVYFGISAHTILELKRNNISFVQANLGSGDDRCWFTISQNNAIGTLRYHTSGFANITVDSDSIKKIEHNLSDSSSISMNGAVFKKILMPKN
jgi:hypothetical protein